ncbi:hypothetical protein [Amycolatopsis kentuckyensis]|uniref:hypothetical protein n=1 Tax=Amycolatopsis kentuckyensis TaxID=218823 RepID=UPI00356718B5
MPERPADDPLKHTQARVRLMCSVARDEVHCMALPTDRGTRWFPAGKLLAAKADNWLNLEVVRELWTSRQALFRADVGTAYLMRLTDKGLQWLRDAPPSMLDRPIDRRVS